MLFDLDDTLLNRDKAVGKMFLIILEKCYEDVKHSAKKRNVSKIQRI
jgi:putative hydrolase of the HAD superfamily